MCVRVCVCVCACVCLCVSVSVSVETRRSDDLYTGASPDGDGVEAERWPLLGGDGGRKEMGRGRLEVLVDNAWRTHVGRRGGEGCYDTYRSVLYKDPRASPWPLRVTGVSYARARQRPGGLTVSPHARFGTASGGGRKCGEKRRGVGRRAAPRTAGHPSRGRDTCGSEGRSPPRRAMLRRYVRSKSNAAAGMPHRRCPSRLFGHHLRRRCYCYT